MVPLGDERVSLDEIPPLPLQSVAYPYPRRSLDLYGPFPAQDVEPLRLDDVLAVEAPIDRKRLGEFPRPICEPPHVGDAAVLDHLLHPLDRLEGPDEDGARVPFFFGGEVEAPVDTVREEDIHVARLPEHQRVPLRDAPIRVARRVVPAAVGLDLDDPARENLSAYLP